MKLADVFITSVLQPRGSGLDSDVVADYTARIKAGDKFPPLVAYKVTDRTFPAPALAIGFHRHAAYLAAGVQDAEVELREGTFAEAWHAAYTSNLTHGLRYTNAQKREAVKTACMMFRHESSSSLASRMSVSHPFVLKVRGELIASKQIDPPAVVVSKDGQQQPARKPKQVPPAGGTSNAAKVEAVATLDAPPVAVAVPHHARTEPKPAAPPAAPKAAPRDSLFGEPDDVAEVPERTPEPAVEDVLKLPPGVRLKWMDGRRGKERLKEPANVQRLRTAAELWSCVHTGCDVLTDDQRTYTQAELKQFDDALAEAAFNHTEDVYYKHGNQTPTGDTRVVVCPESGHVAIIERQHDGTFTVRRLPVAVSNVF